MMEAALSSCSMERFAMSHSGSASVVSRVFDAALSPESWQLALEAVAETAGVGGISLSGPSAAFEGNYVFHYAAIDGYSPLIVASAQGRWLKLSKCFSKSRLRTDEWYNDFVVEAGVDDILGGRLADHHSPTALFGIPYD